MVKPIPDGYHSLTPYLIVDGASDAIAFYTKAFGAKEYMRMAMPNGKIMHAEIKIGDSFLMLADENPEWEAKGPKSLGGSPMTLMLYVPNVDEVVAKAVSEGATLKMEVADQFYGDRCGSVIDPFGHSWHISTHVEDVPEDEMRRRSEEMMKKK